MAEHVSARIRIGGRLDLTLLPELAERALEDRAGPDWGDRFRDPADVEGHVRESAGDVQFFGDEIRNGEFYALQAFCVAHGLTYVLTYDGCGGNWGPARRRWRPGDDGEGVACVLSEDGGRACITADEIAHFRLGDVPAILAYLSEFDRETTPSLVLVDG